MKRLLLLIFFAVFLNAENVVNDANDLCYEEPVATGGFLCKITNEFSGGICTAGGGCGIEFPLKNIGDLPLENVTVDYNESDVGGSFGDNCKANPSGTCKVVHNIDMGIFGILGTATEFNFNDPITPTSNNVSAESSALMSVKCFEADNLYASYIKDGVLHKGRIRLCGTAPLPDDENNLIPECGVFSHMFQVRNPCNGGTGGHIDFNNAGQTLDGSNNIILNSPSNYLNACLVETKSWVKNQYETCGDKGDCVQSGQAAKSLNIIYDNPPQLANVSTVENGSSTTVKIETSNSVKNLYGNKYNEIKPKNGGIVNYTINFHINNSLSINKISTTVGNIYNFSSSYPYNLKIIDFKIKSNGSGNSVITDDNLKNLEIGHFEQASNTNVTLKAINSIKMNEFYVGRGSTVLIKAPYVDIDHFEPTNSGSGNTIIDIYADYIDMDYIELAQNVTLRIHPFTPGKKILMRTNNITESSSSTILVSSGNYYINDDWVLPGTSDVSAIRAIDKNQKVNIFLNHGLQVGNNPGINSLGNNGNFGDNPAVNFKIFVNGSFKTGGGGTTINALLYVEGDVELGNPSYIRGAVSAYNKIEIGQGQFIFDQNITTEGWGQCRSGVYKYTRGPFDAWDIFRNINDRNISTKIVNKTFNLTLASLNDSDNAVEQKNVGDINVSIFDMISGDRISDIKHFNTNAYAQTQKTFTIHKASKDARVGFLLCSDYDSSAKVHTLYNYSHCKGNIVDCNITGLHFRRCYSSDNFAIRPKSFSIKIYPKVVRAGSEFNLTIDAIDENNFLSKNYNENLNIRGNSPELNYSNTKKDCLNGNLYKIVGGNFKNGEVNITLKYNEVGDLNITIKEINGSEFAKVDEDDKDVTGYWNGKKRFITFTNKIIVFIPYDFKINANYKAFGDFNFTYISNNLNMASVLDINITAQNKQKQITKNYNSKCYAQNINLIISHLISNNIPDKPKKILLKNSSKETNFSLTENISETVSKDYFTTDNNGSAALKLKINFERNYSNPVMEFNFTVKEINITDSNDTNGSFVLDKNVTFRYGRIDVQSVYGYGNELNTTYKYEYWSNEGWILNKAHKSVLGDVNKSNKYYQYIKNNFDVNLSIGNIVNGKENVTLSTTHALPYSTKIHLDVSSWLWYNPLAKNYKSPLSNQDCLTHPCESVTFDTISSGWSGIGKSNVKSSETNRTAEVNSSLRKVKANKKEVNKINW